MRVAAIQLTGGPDKARNLARAERLVRRAAAAGADLIALPEVFSHVDAPARMRKEAERAKDGPAYALMRALAREHRVLMLAGSITTRVGEGRTVVNRSVLFGSDGRELAHYDKIHLFDTRVGGVSYRESATFSAGARPCVVKTAFGKLGLTICYDLRFPELFRALVLAGARVIFVPSAFTATTGRAHWLPLLQARAIENQVFVVAPGLVGRWENRAWHGNSCIIDPWGRVLARAADRETFVSAKLDFKELERIRASLPALKHIRRDVFKSLRRA